MGGRVVAILRDSKGRQVRTYAGLQTKQYARELHKAGFLAPVVRAQGLERARLQRAATVLVSYLRSGEVSTRSRVCAAQLGLQHYPSQIERLQCSPHSK